MLRSGAFLHCVLVHFWFALDKYNIYNKIEIQSLEYSIDKINYLPLLISGFELQSLMKKCGLKREC